MFYITVALGGYFLNAISAIIDKVLLAKAMPSPRVYAFFICALGMLVFLIAPFGLDWLGWQYFLLSLVAGIFFVTALVAFFTSLKQGEASLVVPVVGAIQPFFILIFEILILGGTLMWSDFLALVLLVVGGVVLSLDFKGGKIKARGWLGFALLSGILFAAFYLVSKWLFVSGDFINGFIWPRLGSFLVVLLFLLDPKTRKDIVAVLHAPQSGSKKLFFVGQACGALSAVLVNYAIALGRVSFVNALQGAQYAFVFLISLFLTLETRHKLMTKSELTEESLARKFLGIILIGAGIYFL